MQPVKQFRPNELFQEFVKDPIDAQSKYALQPVLIEGRITALDDEMILLGSGMEITRIQLIHDWRYDIPTHQPGDYILVKGICRGMDLTELLISHALILTVKK